MRDYSPRSEQLGALLPEDRKPSPNSLRAVLTACRATFHSHTRQQRPAATKKRFLAYLNSVWLAAGPRYGKSSVPYNIFEATEAGSADLYYWHIEAYGDAMGANAAVLLLISRIASEIDRHRPKSADAMLTCLEDTCHALRSILGEDRELTSQDVFALLERYRNKLAHHVAQYGVDDPAIPEGNTEAATAGTPEADPNS